MRQAGVIAAAALVGLEEMRGRLVEDHRNAKRLAVGLAGLPGIRIDAARVVTNIVSFEVDPAVMEAGAFQKACAEKGLRISRYRRRGRDRPRRPGGRAEPRGSGPLGLTRTG